MTDIGKPRNLFWIIAGLALLWNILGVVMFLGSMSVAESELITAYGPEGAQAMLARPFWATTAFAVAVFGGVLGCIALLLRKSLARTLFILSLLGVIVQDLWSFVFANAAAYIGPADWAAVVLVLVIAVFLIWYSHKRIADGTLC